MHGEKGSVELQLMLLRLRRTVYMTDVRFIRKWEGMQYSKLVCHKASHTVIVTRFGKTLHKGQCEIFAICIFSASG